MRKQIILSILSMLVDKSKLLISLLVFCLAAPVKAEDNMTVAGVQYTTTSKNTATAYLTVKALGDVEIKETIKIKGKDYKTTEIGKAYFSKNEYLQSIVIPNSVQRIRKHAFRGCANLSKVVVPDTLCQADEGAFDGCIAIAVITTHNRQFKPDYVLASMDKKIPYYEVKDKINPWVDSDELVEVLDDIEYDVDSDIPVTTSKSNRNTYAFIIGNEDYSSGEAGIVNVPFAVNDAQVFAEYCKLTLGLPEENVQCYKNLTFGRMLRIIRNLKETANAYKDKKNSSIIFYYAGHGFPDEKTRDAYLLPTDGDGKDTEGCYSLARLYKELGGLPVKKVYVFLDACFSGSLRGDGMLTAARGVVFQAKKESPQGNMIVFSAATGDETAYPYQEKKHGMFTYFLLNQLKRYKGSCTLGELGDYVQKKVGQKSVNINKKSQTPTLSCSPNMTDDWRNIKLR